MADKVIGLSVQLEGDQANKTVGSIKTQIREATQDLITMRQKFGDTSTEAANAAKKVAELRDEMGDAKATADAFNPDAKFTAFSKTLQGVAGGFAAMQGAQALFGAESEEVQKTLLKVQAALALSQGINSILELKDTFKNLNLIIQQSAAFQKINAAATAAAASVMRAFGVSTVATSTAFKVLRTAIITTGIGALIVGVGLLVDKIMTWTDSTKDAADAQERLKKITDDLNASLDAELGALDRSGEVLKLQAKLRGKSAADINKIDESTAKLRTQALERQKQEIIKVGGDITEIEQKIQAERQRQEIANLNTQIATKEKSVSEEKQRQDKTKQLDDKADNERKARLHKQQEEDKHFADEEYRRKWDVHKRLMDADFEFAQEEAQAKKEAQERFDKMLQDQQNHSLTPTDSLPPDQIMERAKIIRELTMTATELKLSDLQSEYERKHELIRGNEEAELKLRSDFEKAKSDVIAAENNARLHIVSDTLQQAADLVGKQTVAGKALAIAAALINTYAGATEVLRAKSVLPEPFGTIQKIVSVGTIIATGLKSVKEIMKVNVPGAAGGGSGGSGGASVSAPIQAVQTSTTINQDQVNSIGNAAAKNVVRAFVVSGDINSDRQREERLNRAARLV